ncbi:MAG TPA: N-methyl-L-tryptophan oxidase [Gemmatimonadaceae bacterium]|nr:N-methyl-L-tryptophan oxidase [Gemmatimonadaceae bacterium]
MTLLRSYNAIVVGLGAMGSATLYHLARRGWRVLGLEQLTPANVTGSSHGDSRIIREMYFEHPLYVPLVQRAYELWSELERESGLSLMTINGGLMIGPPDGYVVKGTIRSATEHRLAHEVLDPAETHRRFPAFHLADDLVAVVDPRAGFLDPEACVNAHVDLARSAGADVRFGEPLTGWVPDGDGVRVTTPDGEYTADFLVMAGGAWNRHLLRDISLDLRIERQVMFWFRPQLDSNLFDRNRFPIYAYEYKTGHLCYGFPRLTRGVKAAVMHQGEMSSGPDAVRRSVHADEVKPLRKALRQVLPELAEAPVRETATCVFTNTSDEDFLIDFHPAYPQVLISSPCSGHGFKFSSAIGELQADLLMTGKSRFDLSPFRLDRAGGR